MYKKGCLIFTLSTALISNSFAVDIFPFDKMLKKQAVQQPKNAKKDQITKRTDFSGTWFGFCVEGEKSSDMHLKIKQTDDYIQIENQRFYINMLNTMGMSQKFGTGFVHILAEWDEQGALILRGIWGNYSPNFYETPYLDSASSKWSYSMNNNKLAIHMNHSFFDGLSHEETHENIECTLEKETSSNS